MAKSGETIETPATGERITWLRTAADTGREALEFDLSLGAGAAVSAEHRHVRQVEQFRVLAGSLSVTVAGRESDLEVGDELAVPA
jgi:mannose-6-phosphate isomerase-like protein (cupin superfamily)